MEVFEIYFEEQEAGLCGLHCINSLLQGPAYNEQELSEIAAELDRQERELMLQGGEDSKEFLKYMAKESANISDDGNFSLQVIQKAFERKGLILEPLEQLFDEQQSQESKLLKRGDVFVANHDSHWIALRRVHGWMVNLNSLLKKPAAMKDSYLEVFIAQLISEGYSVYRVKGALPKPVRRENFLPEGKTLHGKWFEMRIHPSDQNNAPPTFVNFRRGAAAGDGEFLEGIDEIGGGIDIAKAIAESLKSVSNNRNSSNCAPAVQVQNGRIRGIDGSIPTVNAHNSDSHSANSTRVHQIESSEDLDLAIAMSLSEQYQQKAH